MAYFEGVEHLTQHIQAKQQGFLVLAHKNLADYPGMVLCISLVWDCHKLHFDLNLEWSSFGLDLFGDTLEESYQYRFSPIESLLSYLEDTYQLACSAMPINYRFAAENFPNPITHPHKKEAYQAAWQRFQADFRDGKFKDSQLVLVYASS